MSEEKNRKSGNPDSPEENGKFRRKGNFTVVDNHIVRDMEVSLQAKGLYLIIQAYITMPGDPLPKKKYREKCGNETAFNNAWKELKNKGYIHTHMHSFGRGKWKVEFDLLEKPEKGPHTFYYNSKGEMTKTNIDAQRKREKTNREKVLRSLGQSMEGEKEDFAYTDEIHTHEEHTGEIHIDDKHMYDLHIGENHTYVNRNTDKHIPEIHSSELDTDVTHPYTDKDYRANTGSKDYRASPSFNHSSQGEANEGVKEAPIIIDPNKRVPGWVRIPLIRALDERKRLPEPGELRNDEMVSLIQILSGWNDYAASQQYDRLEQQTYIAIVQALCEMVTMKGTIDCKGTAVSAENVLGYLNIICSKEKYWESSLLHFINMTMGRIVEKLKEERIPFLTNYCKTVIWMSFATYEADFASFFHRTYYGGENEKTYGTY